MAVNPTFVQADRTTSLNNALSIAGIKAGSYRTSIYGGTFSATSVVNGARIYFTTPSGIVGNHDMPCVFPMSVVGIGAKINMPAGLGFTIEVAKNGGSIGCSTAGTNSVSGNTYVTAVFPKGLYSFSSTDILTMLYTNIAGGTVSSVAAVGHFFVETAP